MKRKRYFILPILSSMLIAGCSATGSDIAYNMIPDSNSASYYTKKDVTSVDISEQSNNSRKEVFKSVIEEEDDIATIFGEDYSNNFDIPIVFNDAVKYFIQYFTTEKRKVFSNWLKRSRYYAPIIKEILNEEGLPEDLVYLAMIESGFNPKAYSPASASGPWQFIYATGGRYGLKSNYWIDERRDPEKSTVAATKYLRDLFKQFGCWYLAAAGYNAGEGRVGRAIVKHNTSDFWELVKYNTLPKETREYIPKLIAAAIIAKEPEKFGFGSITYDEPVKFTEARVPSGTPLSAIAKAASIDVKVLKSINPEILRGITPPDMNNYVIKLPSTTDLFSFNNRFQASLAEDNNRITGVSSYKVKRKDTLARIAKKYRITIDDMSLVNGSGGDIKIKPGMVINIPRLAGSSAIKIADSKKQDRNIKVARAGFTEDVIEKTPKNVKISKKDATEIQSNKSEKTARISRPDNKETARKNYAANVAIKEQKKQPRHHIVKKGETLAEISNKYGIDVSTIKSANNIKAGMVYPNMKLKLVKHIQKKDKREKRTVKYHIVKKGETLTTISNKYGMDIAGIKSVNKLKTDVVHPNMKLRVNAS